VPLPRLGPQLPTPVLHVLLDDALLPTGSAIAELRLEQVVPTHRLEAGVDGAFLAAADPVHRRLHVVVDAATWNAAERSEGASMGIKQHLVALHRIGHHPKRPARGQLRVCHLQTLAHPADDGVLAAPVELERLARPEAQGHKRGSMGLGATLDVPATYEAATRP